MLAAQRRLGRLRVRLSQGNSCFKPDVQGASAGGSGAAGGPAVPSIASEVASNAGSGEEWGQAWKDNLRNNWDSVIGINIQGESLPYHDQFLDLDPIFKDNYE